MSANSSESKPFLFFFLFLNIKTAGCCACLYRKLTTVFVFFDVIATDDAFLSEGKMFFVIVYLACLLLFSSPRQQFC